MYLRIRLIDWLNRVLFQPYNFEEILRYDITYDHLMKLSYLKISGDIIMKCLQFGYIYMNRTGHVFMCSCTHTKNPHIRWISSIYNRGSYREKEKIYFSVFNVFRIFFQEWDMILFFSLVQIISTREIPFKIEHCMHAIYMYVSLVDYTRWK